MDRYKLSIERELKSKSVNIIWPLLSTPEGMSKWLADKVKLSGDNLTFTWGNPRGHHEIRTAKILEKKDFSHIRIKWNEERFENTFIELRIQKSDITGDYILIITDFSIDGDLQTLRDIWEANLDTLRRSTGI